MISIIIPVFNQHEMTRECLEAIRTNTQGYEVVLIDNGSMPPFEPYRNMGPIRIIRNQKNLGFPVAVNQGIRAAKGEFIILLNNDVIVTPGWMKRILEVLQKYSIVGPMTNYCAGAQKTTIPVYESREELDRRASDYMAANAGNLQEVNWIIGFCMAFRRSLFEEIGPFDESLWPCSGEEIDFCLRARKASHKIGIARDVYVHHFGSQTFGDLQKTGLADYKEICERNEKHLAARWGADFWERQAIE